MQKLPYILVVGDKEKAAGTVAVRARGGKDLGVMSIDEFTQLIANDITHKNVVWDFQRRLLLTKRTLHFLATFAVEEFLKD